MRVFGRSDRTAFGTLDHDLHRIRRAPWNPYFSKQSVSQLQPLLVQAAVNKLCERLAKYQAAGKPVVMAHAYACLTLDVISEYAFAEGYNLLDKDEFDSEQYESMMSFMKMGHLLKQFGWLLPLLSSMPLWLIKLTSPQTDLVLQQRIQLRQQVEETSKRRGKAGAKELTNRPSMIEALLNSNLPESEKGQERIAGEAANAIGAGTLTSSHALKHATYYILASPRIKERLMTEVEEAIPNPANPPNLQELHQIQYLVAIFWETMRLFHGVSHRSQRIFPECSLRYNEWVIPPGTPVSMTSVHVHTDPDIFPDPDEFRPERWLPLETEGKRLQKYMMAFGKGSRSCVGMELGKAEVLTALGMVFRRFGRDMRLYQTTREKDIDMVSDMFVAIPSKRSNGLMVMFDDRA